MNLTHGKEDLQRRIDIGMACLRAADPSLSEDNETAASDAISDILTAVVGPAGICDMYGVKFNEDALTQASELLDHAYESWKGDAEDYFVADEEPSSGLERVKRLYDEREKEYRETVEPGVSDNSWLEAQLEVLHDVIGLLEDADVS